MRRRLVSLPMYAVPDEALAVFRKALLAHLAAAGFEPHFDEPDDLAAHWRDPELLLSQTCGYPFLHGLQDHLRLVATPHYDAPACEGAFYRSALVVRQDDPAVSLADLAGRIAAYNSADSQSGYNALRAAVAPLSKEGRFFGGTLPTGGHLASLGAVEEGLADVAAIDAVTLALALDARPGLPVRVLAHTDPAPALPFVTRREAGEAEIERLRGVLLALAADPHLSHARKAMRLVGFEVLPIEAYHVILDQRRAAKGFGYACLG